MEEGEEEEEEEEEELVAAVELMKVAVAREMVELVRDEKDNWEDAVNTKEDKEMWWRLG